MIEPMLLHAVDVHEVYASSLLRDHQEIPLKAPASFLFRFGGPVRDYRMLAYRSLYRGSLCTITCIHGVRGMDVHIVQCKDTQCH